MRFRYEMLDHPHCEEQSPTFCSAETNPWRLALSVLLCVPLGCAGGCEREPGAGQPRFRTEGVRTATTLTPTAQDAGTGASPPPLVGQPADAGADAAPPPWPGPFFTVTSSSTGIYAEAASDRALKIGYARNGGRIPVLRGKVVGEGCSAGWYEGVGSGFICSSEGTIDPEDPRARLSATPPNLSDVLPYPYARNARNGTPLYSSVPSVDQMAVYEPRVDRESPSGEANSAERPWWKRERVELSQVRLAELATESDGLLARRLVQGFYVAVDREFEWGSHTWYKTTKGMVAAKDRFVPVEGSGFHGVELAAEQALPVAWAYGTRESRPRFRIDASLVKQLGSFARLEPLYLTGQKTEVAGHAYLQTAEDDWVQADHVRVAMAPSKLPDNLASDERWISVDLRSQTLVALIGERPVYATLVSSGKETNDAATDHRSPSGEWYLREKHITTTMDGDGSAAGDLPYSIEDVPYVMYFDGSYALHGAFWHRNYGVRMSHGCINLAPLDARYLFFFTDPPVRTGWHGAWSGNGQRGSRVVIGGSTPAPRPRAGPAGP
jgi:lipoprotein-anchoring transpeptidase ErfK/SrfK